MLPSHGGRLVHLHRRPTLRGAHLCLYATKTALTVSLRPFLTIGFEEHVQGRLLLIPGIFSDSNLVRIRRRSLLVF